MSSPAVTIITPTYNREMLLPETVDSMLNQRFSDFEYIVVDDGSTDGTVSMLAGYDDPRLRVLEQAHQGEVAATNHGWAEARGRYVAIVSSDDPVSPLWLGEMVRALESHREAVVAYPDWNILDGEGRVEQVVRTPDYDRRDMLSRFCAPAGPGALTRKSAGDGLTPLRRSRFRYCADFDMWLRLSLAGPFLRVPKVLASWRRHPDSISVAERTRRRADELVELARDFFGHPDLPTELAVLEHPAMTSAYHLAAWVLEDSDPQEAERFRRMAHDRRDGDESRCCAC